MARKHPVQARRILNYALLKEISALEHGTFVYAPAARPAMIGLPRVFLLQPRIQ